jgi:NAD(P)-dependent dehydrogenase (short-subunit alcohol dehydrogenase family)
MNSVMITGASSGIGKALSQHYDNLGWQVLACGRNKGRLEDLALSGSSIKTLAFDMTDKHQIAAISSELMPLDLLIFNAGDCQYIDNPIDFDADSFESIIQTNLISVAYGLKAWLKHVKKGGRVVFVSSSAELLALPRAEAYGASKAALSYLGESLSIDLAKHDIHVSIVRPGFVSTPLTAKNDFPMPMQITSEQAAVQIAKGLAKGKHHIDFPFSFICMMKILACLPFALWRRLAVRM